MLDEQGRDVPIRNLADAFFKEVAECRWYSSENVGYDVGQERAIDEYKKRYWNGSVRAKWLEHLQGKTFWTELDQNDFGLLKHRFLDQQLLLDRILDRLKTGKENLDVIQWALDFGLNSAKVRDILIELNINSRRIAPPSF